MEETKHDPSTSAEKLQSFPGGGATGTLVYGRTAQTRCPHCYRVTGVRKHHNEPVITLAKLALDGIFSGATGELTGLKLKFPVEPLGGGIFPALWKPGRGWVITFRNSGDTYEVVDFRLLTEETRFTMTEDVGVHLGQRVEVPEKGL